MLWSDKGVTSRNDEEQTADENAIECCSLDIEKSGCGGFPIEEEIKRDGDSTYQDGAGEDLGRHEELYAGDEAEEYPDPRRFPTLAHQCLMEKQEEERGERYE